MMQHPLATDVKEQVRQATDIVDLVGGYIPLRRQGRNFVGLCPWHDDSRPSMQVNPERQSYKCWVCDVGGDVFSFMMKQENLEFREALEALAERVGIPMRPQSHGQEGGSNSAGSPTEKKTLLAATAWAETQFHLFLLESPQAAPVRDYLAQRNFTQESISRFHIGFSPPEWDWLLRRSRAAGISSRSLEAVGLVRVRPSGEGHYDFFRGRVMFPIRDVRNRPIAFGGRVLPQLARDAELLHSGVISEAKYFNSPETPLFSKSSQLFGLDLAKDSIPRPGKPESTVIIMEGYTDCIMAHQNGVENAVAVLGTALTERHIPVLRRYADTVLLVLDGDEAGQKRASEVLEIFIAQSVDLRILTLPQDLDPCDFIGTHGGEAFRELTREAVDALEHKIRTVTKGMVAASDTHRANVAVEEILGTLARIPRPAHGSSSAAVLREQLVLSRLANDFRVEESLLRSRLAALRRTERRSPPTDSSPDPGQQAKLSLHAWDRELFELVFLSSDVCAELMRVIAVDDFRSEAGRALGAMCLEIHENDELPSFETLMLHTEDPAQKSLLVEVDEASRSKQESDLDQRLGDLLESRGKRHAKQKSERQLAILREGSLNEQTEEEVLEQFLRSLKSRQPGSEPTEG